MSTARSRGDAPARPLRVAASDETASRATPEEIGAARSLAHAIRTHGHLAARLDPLGTEPPGDPSLEPAFHGLDEAALARIGSAGLNLYVEGETLADALPLLRQTYCGGIAYQIEHISDHRERIWLREAIESGTFTEPMTPEQHRRQFRRIARVEALEQYLRRSFLGEKTFSIEGIDVMVLMLDEAISIAAADGISEAVLGMAHRGRLNVLAHVLRRPYASILAEFEGRPADDVAALLPIGGGGDVKYHHGARALRRVRVEIEGSDAEEREVQVSLMPNPSHLEFVNPVVNGRVRALQTDHSSSLAARDLDRALAVQIHGDAAFPGQGIVAETLNLQSLPGYSVGGTLHLIANNQIGFTTDPIESRSTMYSSDLAKGYDVPIIHVNADDIVSCRSAVRLAMAFRREFGHDVLIDLIGYRRSGHNEGDEPAYTQALMYDRIRAHDTVGTLYGQRLVDEGVMNAEEVADVRKAALATIAGAHDQVKGGAGERKRERRFGRDAAPEAAAPPTVEQLQSIQAELLSVPEGFAVHPKLLQQLERRREAIETGAGIDWGQGESLAFATLLGQGVPVRMTGQDTERGTFSHRHLVLHDVSSGERYAPMQHLSTARASFEIHNSPLSENACLGFEYGFAITAPDALVIWEAQFGDFANGAQVIVDQFIASGRSKWGQTSRLTLFLPHGYEGNGPEHSSARLERFLQLAADDNMRIANLTTPAQLFHLLRRQATIAERRPLVLMTPKGLLRLKESASRLTDFTEGRFQRIIDDESVELYREDITRLVMCSGKIYYDIQRHPERAKADETAIARVELLYPFPLEEMKQLLAGYPNLESVVWAQEEPTNMGPWRALRHRIESAVPRHVRLDFAGRPWRASPSEGYSRAHQDEQLRITTLALGLT